MENTIYVSALVMGLTAVAKKSGLKTKYLPVFAVIAGIVLTMFVDGFTTEAAIVGLMTSLTTMGLYSGGKAVLTK